MMRTVITAVGGILIGPFAGYYGMYGVISILPHHDCMWRLGAFAMSLFVGAPLGAVTFAVIGFCVGYRLDKKARLQQPHQDESISDGVKGNLLNDGLADHQQS